ncbi:MAG: substrate-binding domain-containing protein [Gammaproteobacteria bacterium]
MATTTSTDNSGLLKALLPDYEKASGQTVNVIAVGTGKALRMGEAGDADVVLVHSRKAEDKFVTEGHGVNHRDVMYNDFVIVGPQQDPAGIRGEVDSANALKRIAESNSLFISRGDTSGTHKKELSIWKSAAIQPSGKWYREAGQGMGKVLQISSELSAYTLTDRGTWLSFKHKTSLKILVEGDKRLFNPYGVIAVNPNKYHDINYVGAMSFIAWLTSPEAQQKIADYRINNELLFTPMAVLSKQ